MKIDKRRAEKKDWRISENHLLIAAASLGALGVGIGMLWFRHKTQKWKFKLGVPALLLFNIFIIYYVIKLIN